MEIFVDPVSVVQLTDEQKQLNEILLDSNGSKTKLEKLILTPEQHASIPDEIDGVRLTIKNKKDLLSASFKPKDSDAFYFVDDKGFLNRDSEKIQEKRVSKFVNFQDVRFNIKNIKINNENLDYLKNSLKYLGFGENLNSSLEARLQQGNDKFTISAIAKVASPVNADLVSFELRFSKSKTTDKYFLNNYQASLGKGLSDEKNETVLSQVFNLNKGNDITAKEAYNLLSGRAIQKQAEVRLKPIDGVDQPKEKQTVWLKLDFDKQTGYNDFAFKSFFKNYGFDLRDTLQKYPIKELNDPDKKERLISSLNRGNLQSVTFERNGVEEKVFISPNPQYKNLDIYSEDLKPQFHRENASNNDLQRKTNMR